MPCKESQTDFDNIHVQQLKSGTSGSWQWQVLNTHWKPGLLPQGTHPDPRMSSNLENYQFINGEGGWDIKGEMHNLTNPTSNFIPSSQQKNHVNFNLYNNNEAHLVLKVPPENRFRYRYDTEMSGTHGSLQGIRTGREKSIPTVELVNYSFEAFIRVSLVTCNEGERYPHPHSLFVKEKLYQKKVYDNWDEKWLTKTGHYPDPHYIRIGRLKNDYLARFEGMCIINSKKENFHTVMKDKLRLREVEVKKGVRKHVAFDGMKEEEGEEEEEEEELEERVEAAVSYVDVDFVSLCFEAFREENGKLFPICEAIYSEPIGNAKSAKTGKLKISRINKCSGSCRGGDEIWMLVEKINKKGLVVRFSEECNGKIMWESCIEGDDLILHHQYAIIFKTPPYKDVNISSEVEVLMRLERNTQPNQPCDYSEPITFVYEPIKIKANKGDNLCRKESILAPFKQFQTKRPRTESSSGSPFYHQNKRRTDDLELDDMELEDSVDDIVQLLFGGKDSLEFDQAWGKFNVEEFLRFISSDDVDMPLQKDGVAQSNKFRRDFFYKLYLLYSKLDENDIKKLTDQISNFRVSKKEMPENKTGNEKDQVKDAASTLLTLRSKAMINNNNKADFTGKPPNKMESLNRILNSSESDVEVPSPKQTSVIKFNSPKTKLPSSLTKNVKESVENEFSDFLEKNWNSGEDDPMGCKVIKIEKDFTSGLVKLDKLTKLYRILNETGSWENLADLWNCLNVVTSAKESSNPSKTVFEFMEKIHGSFDLDFLRSSLNAVNDKNALRILDETLAEYL